MLRASRGEMESCINFKKLVVAEGGGQRMHPSDVLHLPSRVQRYRNIRCLVETFGSWGRGQGLLSFHRKYWRRKQKAEQM